MNTGDKKTWTRIAAAVAAVVLLAVCFALSKDVCLALSRREMTLTGTVADKSVTWQGPTLVLRADGDGADPYWYLACTQEEYDRAAPGDRVVCSGVFSRLTRQGTAEELKTE